MKPLPFKAYFFPGGGSGIWMPAVLTNSSKEAGRLWFCLIQPIMARFKNCKVVIEPVLVVVIAGGFAICAGAAVATGAGVEETVTELAGSGADCGAAAGAGVFDLLHPAASAAADTSDREIVFGRQPGNRTKSINGFIVRAESVENIIPPGPKSK